MSGAPDTFKPIWRTPLAAVLTAWMLAVVLTTLAAGRLLEVVPGAALYGAALLVYLAPIPPLLAWGVWAMLKEPLTGWLAPTLLFTFCGGFVPAAQPLFDAGVTLNFEMHRARYDAIVEEAKTSAQRREGYVEGVRDGVRFRYRASRPGEIDFPWRDRAGEVGVRYDDTPCVTVPGRRCIARGRPLGDNFVFYQRIL